MVKRSIKNNKTIVSLYNKPLESIARARSDFITNTIKASNNQLEYVGELDPANVDYPATLSNDLGKELTVEFHLFRNKVSDVSVVIRWRLNEY